MMTQDDLDSGMALGREEAGRLRAIARSCHETGRRALAEARVAMERGDDARADRYLEAVKRLIAACDFHKEASQQVLLTAGRTLRAAGG